MFDTTLDSPIGNFDRLSDAVSQALGKALHAAKDEFPHERLPENFTRELRDPTYKALGLTKSQISTIEEMVLSAPARKPGKGARDNLITLVPSQKNGGQRWLESHTVERLFYYEVERDPEVIGYVTQVGCRGVTRKVRKGKHVSNATLDFLVFYKDRIVLVECKTEDALDKLVRKKKDEWCRRGDLWTNKVYEEFASRLGIELQVFAVGNLFSIELQNAEFINVELRSPDTDEDRRLRLHAAALLRDRPLTIEQLREQFSSFTTRTAAKMLAEGTAFGLERIISMADEDTFLLFGSIVHRDVVDAELWHSYLDETAELRITDRLLLAKAEHVEIAKRRWARLQRIKLGQELGTKRMTALWKIVSSLIEDGISPIEACLPDYPGSGNRGRRLGELEFKALQKVVERWSKGEFSDRGDAWFELEALCKADGAPVPHLSTLNREIRKADQTRRTLVIHGLRQYQKDKARTDGSRCSLPSIAFGHTLMVDSSNFDQRVAANLLTYFPSSVPRFYAGVDGATGYPMAHALMFGPARTDGLAMLMREFVSRHGFLPRCIQLDRGPENTGSWIKDFADHFGIELRWTPTGGSRYNGQAENIIGRVNHAVAHKGTGSTLPDQRGRATDGRVKSRKTATKAFEYVVRQFEAYYYGELAHIADSENLSPTDKRDHLLEYIGKGGRPCKFDDAFRVLTSIPIDVPKHVSTSRGIRLVEGTYAGDALNSALSISHITELRKDCINPAAVYAKAGGQWYRAFRRDCTLLLHRSSEERLYKLLSEPSWRSERAARNLEQKRVTHDRRVAEMQEAMTGKEHLTDVLPKQKSQETAKRQVKYPEIDWASLGVSISS